VSVAGLQTLDAFRAAREETARRDALGPGGAGKASGATSIVSTSAGLASKARAGAKRKLLSFTGDDDEDEGAGNGGSGSRTAGGPTAAAQAAPAEPVAPSICILKKDPSVQTDFLPDSQREAREAAARAAYAAEWAASQASAKAEKLNVVYSYWDGSGHRREAIVTKGSTIGAFLESARRSLVADFAELKTSDSLIFVKEDLIIPHNITFYELISTGARGKSGPLFDFQVRDDVRLVNDARVERDDSHPGKVLDRRWYEKNKHIFPYSRYELFDPLAKRGAYTIKDGAPSKH
jgi:protein FAM50